MTTIEPEITQTVTGAWDCPRCGRCNRDRDHSCPNCRCARRAETCGGGETGSGAPGRLMLRRIVPPPVDRLPAASGAWRDPLPRREGGPDCDAAALAALASLLAEYQRWLEVTHGPHHRLQVGAAYTALVPADAPLLESFRFEAPSLAPGRLGRHGPGEAAAEWEAAAAEPAQEAETVPAWR